MNLTTRKAGWDDSGECRAFCLPTHRTTGVLFPWPSRSRFRRSCVLTPTARSLSTGAGDTLSALLDNLDVDHPGLKGRLITDDGGLHRFVNVYVNDEDVRFTGSLDTVLKDGDSVTILPAVAGG